MKKYLERVKREELSKEKAAILYAVGVPFTIEGDEEEKVIKTTNPSPGCVKVISKFGTHYKTKVKQKTQVVLSSEEEVLAKVTPSQLNLSQKEKYNEFLKRCEKL